MHHTKYRHLTNEELLREADAQRNDNPLLEELAQRVAAAAAAAVIENEVAAAAPATTEGEK